MVATDGQEPQAGAQVIDLVEALRASLAPRKAAAKAAETSGAGPVAVPAPPAAAVATSATAVPAAAAAPPAKERKAAKRATPAPQPAEPAEVPLRSRAGK